MLYSITIHTNNFMYVVLLYTPMMSRVILLFIRSTL